MVYINRILLSAFVLGLFGCASLGVKVTSANNTVQMPHYSVVIPPDEGWYLQTEEGPLETAVVSMNPGGDNVYKMQFRRITVLDEKLRALPAAELAADYLAIEKKSMQQRVKKGAYELNDVATTEETHGEKTFYAMQYRVDTKDSYQYAMWLYLYIPKETDNEWFIGAHYSVTASQKSFMMNNYFDQFTKVLASLQTR